MALAFLGPLEAGRAVLEDDGEMGRAGVGASEMLSAVEQGTNDAKVAGTEERTKGEERGGEQNRKAKKKKKERSEDVNELCESQNRMAVFASGSSIDLLLCARHQKTEWSEQKNQGQNISFSLLLSSCICAYATW